LKDVAVAYEYSGYEPDEITPPVLYSNLSLGDVHRALSYCYDDIDDVEALGVDVEPY
jgi:hypothetical protein